MHRPDVINGRFTSRVDTGAFGKFRRKGEDSEQVEGERESSRTQWRTKEHRRDTEEAPTPVKRFDRQLDWRSGSNREWSQPERTEAEPEWMDSTEPEEPSQVHTQEDFQRWKERMKAGSGNAPAPADSPSVPSAAEQKAAKQLASAMGVKSPDMEDAMDTFFAKFNPAKAEPDIQAAATQPSKRGRFASLWSASTEQTPASPPPAPPSAPPIVEQPVANQPLLGADTDQAGFARILQMLGSRNAGLASQESSAQAPLSVLTTSTRESRDTTRPMSAAYTEQLRAQPSNEPSRPLSAKSPERPPHQRHESSKETSDFLLNLMKQVNINQQTKKQKPEMEERPTLSSSHLRAEEVNKLAAHQNATAPVASNRMPPFAQRDAPGRGMFDDMHAERSHERSDDFSMPRFEHERRERPMNGSQPPYYEEEFSDFRHLQDPSRKHSIPQHSNPGPPPGFQRPPGFDNPVRMPPGWPGPQQEQPPRPQQTMRPDLPPNPPFGPPLHMQAPHPPQPNPQQLHYHQQQLQQLHHQQLQQHQHQQAQRPPQRKYTGEGTGPGPAFHAPPPALPPGFMGNRPLPPGFPGNAPPPMRGPGGGGGGGGYPRYEQLPPQSQPQLPPAFGRPSGPGAGPGALFAELYGGGGGGVGAGAGPDRGMRVFGGQPGAGAGLR